MAKKHQKVPKFNKITLSSSIYLILQIFKKNDNRKNVFNLLKKYSSVNLAENVTTSILRMFVNKVKVVKKRFCFFSSFEGVSLKPSVPLCI